MKNTNWRKPPVSMGLLNTIVKKGKLRIDEYRIIYSFKGKRFAILVIEIGHHRDIYQVDAEK